MRRAWLAALAAAAASLGACDPLFSVCHVCLKGDSMQVVSAADRALVLRGDKDHPLPASATDLHYHEECGIDCTMWFRFDAPAADVEAYAKAVFDTHRATFGAPEPKRAPVCDDAPCPWWPARFPAGAGAYADDASAPVSRVAVVRRSGATARVWLVVAER